MAVSEIEKEKRGNDVLRFLSFRELLFLFSVGDCVRRRTWYSIAFAVPPVPPAKFAWLAKMAFLKRQGSLAIQLKLCLSFPFSAEFLFARGPQRHG
jgi:hypothetical protein